MNNKKPAEAGMVCSVVLSQLQPFIATQIYVLHKLFRDQKLVHTEAISERPQQFIFCFFSRGQMQQTIFILAVSGNEIL